SSCRLCVLLGGPSWGAFIFCHPSKARPRDDLTKTSNGKPGYTWLSQTESALSTRRQSSACRTIRSASFVVFPKARPSHALDLKRRFRGRRRLLAFRGRKAGVVRRLGRQAQLGFQFGHPRRQRRDLRHQRRNQRIFLFMREQGKVGGRRACTRGFRFVTRAPALHLAGLIAPGVAIVAHCVEHFAQHLHLDLQRIDAQGALGRASAVASGCIASCGARCMASGGKTRKSSTGTTSIAPASIRVALIRQADSTSATRPPPLSLDRASPPTAAPRPAADLFLSRRGAISRPRGALEANVSGRRPPQPRQQSRRSPPTARSPRLHPRQMSFTIQVVTQSSAASTTAFGAG